MKYLFILGRNIELSIKEVLCYFEKINNPVYKYVQQKNSLLIDVEEKLESFIIDKFGGVISIGEVLANGTFDEIKEKLGNQEIYLGEENKFNYVLWDFATEGVTNLMSEYLKKRFRSEKLKAVEKRLTGLLKLQDGTRVVNVGSSLIDIQYFLFGDTQKGTSEKENYFGKIIAKCDYSELEARDMEKPVRRESLSISPRLAKIMINLSKVKENQMLVDPFCGIGVILQEALIQGIQVIGVDRDKKAIGGARKNLEWANLNKEDYQLIRKDSGEVDIEVSDAIVTEPDLGEVLRKIPTKNKAKKIQQRFENLVIDGLNNLKNKISGRIVFTAPLIRTGKKRISCNVEKILEQTGLTLAEGFPIKEYREKQIVGRDIFVLE